MSNKIENIDEIDNADEDMDVDADAESVDESDSDEDPSVVNVNESIDESVDESVDESDSDESDDYQESEDDQQEQEQEQYISKTKIQNSIVVEDLYKDSDKFYNEYDSKNNILSKKLTKYEITALIGIRADQISLGSNTFLNEKELEKVKDITNPELIAEQELFSTPCKLPFIIRRPIANNKYEYSKLSDLIF